jgi:hypothetical protein
MEESILPRHFLFMISSKQTGIFQKNQKVVDSLKTIIFFLANLLFRKVLIIKELQPNCFSNKKMVNQKCQLLSN